MIKIKNDGFRNLIKLSSSAAFALMFSFNHCATFPDIAADKPGFQFRSASISGIDREGIHLKIIIDLKNNYPLPLPKSNLLLNVTADEQKLTSLTVPLPEVSAGKTAPVSLSVTAPVSLIEKTIKSFPDKETIRLNLNGGAEITLMPSSLIQMPADMKTPSLFVPFSHTEELPVFLPVIEIKDFKITRPDLMNSVTSFSEPVLESSMSVIVKNTGKARFLIQNPEIRVTVEGTRFIQTKTSEIINRGTESQLTAETHLPVAKAGSALLRTATSGKAAVNISGDVNLVFNLSKSSEPVHFSIDKTGNFFWKN
jgi:hypothetical protein